MSSALGELTNLVRAAKWHRQECKDTECGVSLFWLGVTAQRLAKEVNPEEQEEALRLLEEGKA